MFFLFYFIQRQYFLFRLKSLLIHTIEVTQDQTAVIFRDGSLYFKGFIGQGSFQIYSIIGNKISEMDVQNFSQFKINTSLEMGNMYIIRVTIKGKSKTFKIIAS